jgi:hypothetical protein
MFKIVVSTFKGIAGCEDELQKCEAIFERTLMTGRELEPRAGCHRRLLSSTVQVWRFLLLYNLGKWNG